MKNEQDQTKRDQLARNLFLQAIEIDSETERMGFVNGACRQDDSLRSRVLALLQSHQEDSFLEMPATPELTTFDNDPLPEEQPGTKIGRYKVLQRIGEGGFGTVYMAEQKDPVKRRVALKIIKLGMDTKQVVARFEAERQALALMDHPNIAKVLDAGSTDSGRPYFVMELVRGISITQYCDENNLGTQQRLHLFLGVCSAIQHAHQKGIIHRDIKPSNVMVTLHDGEPVPKVIDFGIAKATQQELTEKTLFTHYSQFIGTPAYMSPEQAEMSGLDVDTRSDIYSLGVLLYELLTGKTPLDNKELMSGGHNEIRRRIREEEPPKPSTRVSTMGREERTQVAKDRDVEASKLSHLLSGDLDWVVMKSLEKDRTRRYETANALRLDVKRYLSNEPVTAMPPSPGYLLGKYLRRNKAAVSFALTIALLLVVATTVSMLFAFKANQAKFSETEQRRMTEKANRELTRRVFESLIADANRVQSEGKPGYGHHFWSMIQEAKTIAEEQNYSETNIFQLRNLAIRTLADRSAVPYVITPLVSDNGETEIVRVAGDQIAIGYPDGHITVCDPLSGEALYHLESEHEEAITSIEHLAEFDIWITADASKKIILWSQKESEGIYSPIRSIQVEEIQGDPRVLAAGAGFIVGHFGSKTLYHWSNIHTQLPHKIQLPYQLKKQAYHQDISYFQLPGQVHPNGKTLAIGFGHHHSMLVIDLTTHSIDKELKVKTHQQSQNLVRASFSPDGAFLMGASRNILTLFRTADWSEHDRLSLHDYSGEVSENARFHPDNQHIIIGSKQKRLWDFKKPVFGERFPEMKGEVFYSPSQKQLFTIIRNLFGRSIYKVDNQQGRWFRTLRLGLRQVRGGHFSPDGTLLALSTSGLSVRSGVTLFDLKSDLNFPEIFLERGYNLDSEDPTFSPDGRVLCANDKVSKSILFWDIETGHLIDQISVTNLPVGVMFHPKKPILGIAAEESVSIWNFEWEENTQTQNLKVKLTPIMNHHIRNLNAYSVRFSDVGPYIAWSESHKPLKNGVLRVLDYERKQLLEFHASNVPVFNGFDFVPNSSNLTYFVPRGNNSTGTLWDPIGNHPISEELTGQLPSVWFDGVYRNHPHLPFSVLSTGGYQAIWSLNPDNEKRPLCVMPRLKSSGISSSTWSPDGNQLATCYNGGQITIWNFKEMRRQLAERGLDWQ